MRAQPETRNQSCNAAELHRLLSLKPPRHAPARTVQVGSLIDLVEHHADALWRPTSILEERLLHTRVPQTSGIHLRPIADAAPSSCTELEETAKLLRNLCDNLRRASVAREEGVRDEGAGARLTAT